MPKIGNGGGRARPVKVQMTPPARAPNRQRPAPASEEPVARPAARSIAMQLAAEVERLERELAAARSRMALLEAHAEIDPLTGLINRRGFERELARALAYVKRYGTCAALIYLDLDGFKPINDRHGHAAGDAVLKCLAMVLTRHVRRSDLVARIGGDEFVALLWNIDAPDAQAKASELEAVVARMTAGWSGATLTVGASAGVAQLLPLDTPAQVLERADRAMYARKSGRAVAAQA